MSQNLHIVSVATEQKFYMKYLISSIKNNNGELVISALYEEVSSFREGLAVVLSSDLYLYFL